MKHALNLVLLVLVALNIYSCRKKNELPIYADFSEISRRDPVQTPTQRPPFTARVENQTHHVKPLYDYHIARMVVSCGFSKNMAEYRSDDLNIKGCLVSYSGRGSSVNRTDSGDGACETIWVDEFEILQDGTKHWHFLHRASLYGWVALLAIQGIRFLCIAPPGYKA